MQLYCTGQDKDSYCKHRQTYIFFEAWRSDLWDYVLWMSGKDHRLLHHEKVATDVYIYQASKYYLNDLYFGSYIHISKTTPWNVHILQLSL